MANGIYLNDIPMDLFLKYFTKEDLEDRILEPSMVNDIRTFFKYTVSINSTNYTHYSTFSNDVNLSQEIREEIVYMFSDIVTGISNGDIDSIIAAGSGDLVNAQAYSLREEGFVIPNKYYFEEKDGSYKRKFVLVNSLMEPAITTDLTGVSIADIRTNTTVVSGVSTFSIIRKDVTSSIFYFEVYNNTTLVGYLRIYDASEIQEINSEGRLLYINESGNKTTEFIRRSNFLRHNRSIRKGIFSLENPIDIISLRFNPRTVGFYREGVSLKLAFYQNFERTVTYKRVSSSFVSSNELDSDVERIRPDIKSEIPNINDTYDVDTIESKIKEVADISLFRRISAQKNGNMFTSLSSNQSFVQGEVVLVDTYERKLRFENINYAVNPSNVVSIQSSGNLANLEIKTASNGLDYLRLPIIISSNQKKAVVPGQILDIQQTQDGRVKFFIYKGDNYFIEFDDESTDRYPNGFISIRVDIIVREIDNGTYIGVAASTGRSSLLNKYSPTITEIDFTDDYFEDTSLYTEDSGVYTRVYYIRDEYDPKFFVEITDSITKQTAASIPSLGEFIDYEHTVVTSSEDFTLISGTKVDRGSSVTTYSKLSDFERRFSLFNHYASNKYYEERGELIRDDVILNKKKSVLIKMISEYMGLNSQFYASVGLFYSSDAIMKMRIVSDGFYSLLSNMKKRRDSRLRKLDITFDNIKGNMLFYKLTTSETENFKIKEYQASDFITQRVDTRDEISRINSFQKIFDYKAIPYNEKRNKAVYERNVRSKIFSDSDSSTFAKDEVRGISKSIDPRSISRSEFKAGLISIMAEFFEVNNYSQDDFFVTSYYKYFRDKLQNLNASYGIKTDPSVTYKSIINKTDILESEESDKYDDIISKILSDEEDWRLV
jgi:hypothetical protein